MIFRVGGRVHPHRQACMQDIMCTPAPSTYLHRLSVGTEGVTRGSRAQAAKGDLMALGFQIP